MTGKLYGVGVGPGDPELLTLKARRVLESVDVLCAPDSGRAGKALEIVRRAVKREFRLLRPRFPMTRRREVLERAWREASEAIYAELERGEDVAFVTLGDPTFYSTFAYVMQRLRAAHPEVEVEIVPGVTSLSACAASLGEPLVSGGERLAVVPAAYGLERLEQLAENFDTIVLMKVSRSFDAIAERIERLGLSERAVFAARCGSDAFFSSDLASLRRKEVDYLSMILIRGLRR
ncbi:MAG: precorrin-2 C(20)-methyltransferase [Euryarchaeota archaeon]|nr:precorrin-2 C(20)-methyltransferase [Euryarchaeota archaeon]